MKTVLALTALAIASTATIVMAAPEAHPRHAAILERLRAADTNQDGAISREEAKALPRIDANFDAIDANKDGKITQEELRAFHQAQRARHAKARGEGFIKHLDTNGDGKVSKAEALAAAEARFDRADLNKDGYLTLEELQAARQARHAQGHGR